MQTGPPKSVSLQRRATEHYHVTALSPSLGVMPLRPWQLLLTLIMPPPPPPCPTAVIRIQSRNGKSWWFPNRKSNREDGGSGSVSGNGGSYGGEGAAASTMSHPAHALVVHKIDLARLVGEALVNGAANEVFARDGAIRALNNRTSATNELIGQTTSFNQVIDGKSISVLAIGTHLTEVS